MHVNRAAIWRELDGIREQIPDNLLETRAVGPDGPDGGVRFDVDANVLRVGGRLHDFHGGVQDLPHVNRRELQTDGSRHDARHVQQLVDEMRLVFGAVVNRPVGALPAGAIEGAAPEDLRPAENGVERRAQFMGDDGQELILQAVRLFGALARGLLALEQLEA